MKSFRWLAFAAFAAATVPRLAHRGMFVDGVTYASIARNLAAGQGSFWSPAYTATVYPQFHEHPPLGFWLQSLWFRVLGDHLFVERLYAVTVALATGVLIAAIYRQLQTGLLTDSAEPTAGDAPARPPARLGRGSGWSIEASSHAREMPGREGREHLAELDWLPVILWIAVPVVSWAIVGNLLETTVALFTTASVGAALMATRASERSARSAEMITSWSVLSGLLIVAATLTKGPVGLFPLAVPAFFLLLTRGRRLWTLLAAQWMTVAVCALLLWAWGPARTSLTEYVNQQVIAAVAGEREVSGNSFAIVKALLQGVILPMGVVGILTAAAAGRFIRPSRIERAIATLFFAIGLGGTLPILVSAKQAGHYLVPAVPFFALATALLAAPTARVAAVRLGTTRWRAVINIVTVLAVLGALSGAFTPGLGRDRERLADLDALTAIMPVGQTIGLCPKSNNDWGLHAWLERLFHVSLDASGAASRDWFLRVRGSCDPANCTAASDDRRSLVLMKCWRSD